MKRLESFLTNLKKMILSHNVTEAESGITVKGFIKWKYQMSHKLFSSFKHNGGLLVNGSPVYANYVLCAGDTLSIDIEDYNENKNIIPVEMPLNIIYEDELYIAFNKPANVPVHPSFGHHEDTLANGLMFLMKKRGWDNFIIHPVNRIDRDTSGVVIFAKNKFAHGRVSLEMENGNFKRFYNAVCIGTFEKKEDIIDLPIDRKENSLITRVVNDAGQRAITKYRVIKENNELSMLFLELFTGRTHQIRVHLSHIGHPIWGDTLYGGETDLVNCQQLHSCMISFPHPLSGNLLKICCKNDLTFRG